MSVVGIGLDLVATSQIAEILDHHGVRFLERCFRQGSSELSKDPVEVDRVAARWAAKEAFLKALGADVSDIPYRDIEVVETHPGQAKLVLHGRALAALETSGGRRLHLTLSRDGAFAMASVIIET